MIEEINPNDIVITKPKKKYDIVNILLIILIIMVFWYISREAVMCASDPFSYGARTWEKELGKGYRVEGSVSIYNNSEFIKGLIFNKQGSFFKLEGTNINYGQGIFNISQYVEGTIRNKSGENNDINLNLTDDEEELIEEIKRITEEMYAI